MVKEETEKEKAILRATSRLTQRKDPYASVKLPYLSKSTLSKALSDKNIIPIDSSFKFSSFPQRKILRPTQTSSAKVRIPSSSFVNQLSDRKKLSIEKTVQGVTKFPMPPIDVQTLARENPPLVSHYGVCISKLLGD